MLHGTTAWEVNMSHPRGFITICSACGKGQGVSLKGDMYDPQKENDFTTAPSQLCVIIECRECGQVVRVFPEGSSQILTKSDRVKEYEDNIEASLKR
jgi:hypothetical protein